MFAMEEALNNAFNDIETDETLNDALSVYETTHKKVIWFISFFIIFLVINFYYAKESIFVPFTVFQTISAGLFNSMVW